MGLKKMILTIILKIMNIFVSMRPINAHQIAFVSLESTVLESDLKLIYEEIKDHDYQIKTVLIHFDENTLWNNFLYLLNTLKQIVVINTSKVVIINDNNFVISNFKRKGVTVIQVWHAAGAVKKFGNAIKREYPIRNYDYVIANSPFWKKPFSEAFGVREDQVLVTGMPRVDHLNDPEYIKQTRQRLFERYPSLKGKRILLYAPTFRGNIYVGFCAVDFDALKIIEKLDENTVLLYRYHPLMKYAALPDHERIINMNHEATHDLFTIADGLISDFSSIIFDFSLLDKEIYYFVPDLDEYVRDLGTFVDYRKDMAGIICMNEDELIAALQSPYDVDIKAFSEKFFTYRDGCNTKRVAALIQRIMQER